MSDSMSNAPIVNSKTPGFILEMFKKSVNNLPVDYGKGINQDFISFGTIYRLQNLHINFYAGNGCLQFVVAILVK